jgi:toxin ParE1/3/4
MGSNSPRLVWSPEAEDDLVSIWRHGAEAWTEEMADKQLFEIEAGCDRLLDDPMLGRGRHELMAGMRSMPVRPHVVFYRLSKRTIEVVRVLHQRMDVEHVFPS